MRHPGLDPGSRQFNILILFWIPSLRYPVFQEFWTPAFAGVTEMALFTRLEFLDVILFAPILKPFIGMRSQAGFVPLY
jgi:hypothetical protein